MREQIQPTKAFHLLYERWIRHVQRNACRSLGGHSAKKKANRSERDFTNTYISWADSDFSLRSRNDSAPRELGRLGRKREEEDSEGRLRSTGFVFAAADPAGSAHPEGRSQSRCRFDQYECGRWQLRSDVSPHKLRIYRFND